jgi:hypothetical protein
MKSAPNMQAKHLEDLVRVSKTQLVADHSIGQKLLTQEQAIQE